MTQQHAVAAQKLPYLGSKWDEIDLQQGKRNSMFCVISQDSIKNSIASRDYSRPSSTHIQVPSDTVLKPDIAVHFVAIDMVSAFKEQQNKPWSVRHPATNINRIKFQ